MYGYSLGYNIASLGSKLNLSAFFGKMDLWASALDSDGISLTGDVGSGITMKEFSCLKLTGNAGSTTNSYLQASDGFSMLDNTATYEYYLDCIIPEIGEDNVNVLAQSGGGFSMNIRGGAEAGGWYIYVTDSLGSLFQIDGRTTERSVIVTGKNSIKLTFNNIEKSVTVAINNYSETFIHDTSFGIADSYFRIGQSGIELLPVYFKFSKNGNPLNEFIFSKQTFLAGKSSNEKDFYDLIGDKMFTILGITDGVNYQKYWSTQSEINPYKNGYDLYWAQGFIDGIKVSPISALGTSKIYANYEHFYQVLPNKIGYHIFEYLEMPDLAIFDTTNRTYWKAAIESDTYYVGGTAGKERYFHKSWLDYTWINAHIEDAYKRLFYVVLKQHNATGQKAVNVEINDIVLFNEVVSYSSSRKDKKTAIDLGDFYLSRVPEFLRSDGGLAFITYCRKGSKVIMQRGLHLCYSSDYGKTWNDGILVSSINSLADYPLSWVRILSDGTIVIGSRYKELVFSTDNLTTVNPCTLKNADDTAFVFHTPVNASYPGGYTQDFHNFVEDDGLLIFGSYGNSGSGATPINIWYSLDSGQTWKVLYSFGQNTNYTDDGSSSGGTGGDLVGDSSNSVITRHIHGINKGFDGNYYVATGDSPGEMHFLKLVYDADLDTWGVNDLLAGTDAINWQRMRAIGIYERNGYIYWGSDGIGDTVVGEMTYESHGIYRCLVEDLSDITKHELLQALPDEAFYFARGQGNVVFCGLDKGNDKFYISKDGGDTWTEETLFFNDIPIRPAYFEPEDNQVLINGKYILQSL